MARATRLTYRPRPDLVERPAAIRNPFDLEALDDAGQPVRRFARPLALSYTASPWESTPSLYRESALFYLDPVGGQWTEVQTVLDPATGRFTATLEHFSTYAEGGVSYMVERMSSLRGAQTNLFTLSVGYAYNFDLPPGRGGLSPRLGLSYASANHTPASGHVSYVGYGWTLVGADYIYTPPGDANQNHKVLTLQGVTYSLERIDDQTWFAKEEPLLKVRNAGVQWNVWTPDGTQYTFGTDEIPRENYWKLCATADQFRRDVRVPLRRITDPNNNTITYTWEGEAANEYGCPTHYRAVRLRTISYNGGATQVTLDYAARDDRAYGYDSANWTFFPTLRLTTITVQVKENGTGAWRTVRSYGLGQSAGPTWYPEQKVLNLDWLEARGAGGGALPRTTFTYSNDFFTADGQFGALQSADNGYGGQVLFTTAIRSGTDAGRAHAVSTRTERSGIAGTPDAVWSYSGLNWDATGETLNPPLAEGYQEVDVTRPDGGVEKHYFHVLSDAPGGKIDHLAGREWQTTVYGAGQELSRTTTSWASTTASLPLPGYGGLAEKDKPRFVYAQTTDTYQLGQPIVRRMWDYDPIQQGNTGTQYENVTRVREFAGTSGGFATAPTRTTCSWYYPNATVWITGRVARRDLWTDASDCSTGTLLSRSLVLLRSDRQRADATGQGATVSTEGWGRQRAARHGQI